MFSGLIREIAKVKSFQDNKIYIQSPHQAKIGDSIALNGVCLTVIECKNDGFILELTHHTQKCIAIENLKEMVHIEPALKANDRLDGHFVQGHIDAIGTIIKIQPTHNQTDFFIQTPSTISHLLIPKGSVAIDGISLTITDFQNDVLKLTLIPHTLQNTLFHSYKQSRRVNIETDMLVRSVAHLLQYQNKSSWNLFDSIVLGY